MTPKRPWTLKGEMYSIYVEDVTHDMLPTIPARFPDNWRFWFLPMFQWWIWNFRKKSLKLETQSFKNHERSFVRTAGRENSEKVSKHLAPICMRSSVLKVSLSQVAIVASVRASSGCVGGLDIGPPKVV